MAICVVFRSYYFSLVLQFGKFVKMEDFGWISYSLTLPKFISKAQDSRVSPVYLCNTYSKATCVEKIRKSTIQKIKASVEFSNLIFIYSSISLKLGWYGQIQIRK